MQFPFELVISEFKNFKIWTVSRSTCVTRTSFVLIVHTGIEIWRFFYFWNRETPLSCIFKMSKF